MEHDKAKLDFLKALNKAQGLLEPAKKDMTNPHFKSRYASLASVNEAVMGPLTEAGFILLSGGIDINGVSHLRTTLYHVAGHSESFYYPLIKNTENPQHVASSFTYARRYSICAMLNLSTEDDDANQATESVKTVSRQPATTTAQAAAPTGSDMTRFIPYKVEFAAGKGKGEGKTFSKITGPDGTTYSGTELQGQIAESAKKSGKEVVIAFTSSQYGNKATHVKMNESQPDPEPERDAPF